MKDLVRSALEGSRTAIARLLTLADKNEKAASDIQNAIYPRTGKAHLIGITGPAGAGKSTLIGKLVALLASSGQSVAIIACDPSSPNSGGALLGDRIRMHDLVLNEHVFVRSIATRDSTGGLPLAAFRAADIFDACGFDTVIIETVGTGQNQVDIMQAAHTVIAVSAPGLGDDIQAMKSGLLEIADIHAVTKSDISGAGKALMEIENAVRMRQQNPYSENEWNPAVLPVNGLAGEGVGELQQAIRDHHDHLQLGDNLERRCRRMLKERILRESIDILTQSFEDASDESLSDSIDRVMRHELTPTQAAEDFLEGAE